MSWFAKKRVYLDWAASAPVSRNAARAYARAARSFGNPSSPHAEGRAARALLEDARTSIARELAAKADDVLFTSGATEANNIALLGHAYARMNAGDDLSALHMLYLPSAHASVVETMRVLAHLGVQTEPLSIKDGAVDLKALEKSLRPETALVSMDFVDSETGTIWNTREVAHLLERYAALLHVDASQAPLEESIERTRIGADMLVLDAQKAGGARGIGALLAPRSVSLSAITYGGGQERGIKSGTPSPALATAFATALADARVSRASFAARATASRDRLVDAISKIPNVFVNRGKKGVAHILNISLIGRDTDYLVALLDEAGFAVSTKSACESDSPEGSRAVFALTGDTARADSTLRVSWGPETEDADLMRFAGALREATAFLDAHAS